MERHGQESTGSEWDKIAQVCVSFCSDMFLYVCPGEKEQQQLASLKTVMDALAPADSTLLYDMWS